MTNIDSVILLEVPDDISIRRILGRYSCPKCGALYNKFFTKPKKEGICDKCGTKMEFVQRTDDNEETIIQRLKVYKENAKPVIDYYKKKKKIIEVEYPNQLPLEEVKKIIGF
jgi:adenylate kinase